MFKKCIVIAVTLVLLSAAAYAELGVATPEKLPDGVTLQRATAIGGVVDYDNTVNTTSYYYKVGSSIVLDDITRTTSKDIVGITAGFGTTTTAGTFDATAYFYSMNMDTGDVGTQLASYSISGIPVGFWLFDIELPTPLPAASDLYVGFSFTDANAGLIISDPPVLGVSYDYFAKSTNGGTTWTYYNFSGNPKANFCLATYVVPEPGSMLALGTGLIGLLAFRRRRR